MKRQLTVPLWVLLIPMTGSLLLTLQQLLGLDMCQPSAATCLQIMGGLSWGSVVFPHILMFPLVMAVSANWQIAAVLILLDLMLCAIAWRTQPSRLSVARLSAIMAIWIALSAASTFAGPDLMVRAYHLTH